jgi:hypothetical protein
VDVRAVGPDTLHPDKAYDHYRRSECRKRAFTSRIARRRVDSSERLGRHCWVVEPTLAWLNCFCRLAIRYERRTDIHEGLRDPRLRPHLPQPNPKVSLGTLKQHSLLHIVCILETDDLLRVADDLLPGSFLAVM